MPSLVSQTLTWVTAFGNIVRPSGRAVLRRLICQLPFSTSQGQRCQTNSSLLHLHHAAIILRVLINTTACGVNANIKLQCSDFKSMMPSLDLLDPGSLHHAIKFHFSADPLTTAIDSFLPMRSGRCVYSSLRIVYHLNLSWSFTGPLPAWVAQLHVSF